MRLGIKLGGSRMMVGVMDGLACLRGRRVRRLGMLLPPPALPSAAVAGGRGYEDVKGTIDCEVDYNG